MATQATTTSRLGPVGSIIIALFIGAAPIVAMVLAVAGAAK